MTPSGPVRVRLESPTYALAGIIRRPVRLSAQDTALSRRRRGFDSLTGYSGEQTLRDVGKPGNPPALGAGERRFESGHPDSSCRTRPAIEDDPEASAHGFAAFPPF